MPPPDDDGSLAAAVGEFDKLICFYCRDMFPFSMNFGHDHTASDDANGQDFCRHGQMGHFVIFGAQLGTMSNGIFANGRAIVGIMGTPVGITTYSPQNRTNMLKFK